MTAVRGRDHTEADVDGVRAVHVAAFPTPLESRLVDALQTARKAVISARATALGYDVVGDLGEPGYYRRFGFSTASRVGLGNEYGVDAPFMVLALQRTDSRAWQGSPGTRPSSSS